LPSKSVIRFTIAGITLMLLCGGCQSVHVPNPVIAKYPSTDPSSQLDFWHELADSRLTSNDDAFHALLLYLDGTDDSANYSQRVATLKSRQMLPSSFNDPGDQAIERGTLAVAIVKILNIHGGWAMHVFGPIPRYAVKELVYAGIYPDSSPQQTFSGSEFVGIIGRVEDTQRSDVANSSQP
jgi:hypothetical protein